MKESEPFLKKMNLFIDDFGSFSVDDNRRK